jgi:hypothetical protein
MARVLAEDGHKVIAIEMPTRTRISLQPSVSTKAKQKKPNLSRRCGSSSRSGQGQRRTIRSFFQINPRVDDISLSGFPLRRMA